MQPGLEDPEFLQEVKKLLLKQEQFRAEWQEEASILIAEKFALLGEVKSLRRKIDDLTKETASDGFRQSPQATSNSKENRR